MRSQQFGGFVGIALLGLGLVALPITTRTQSPTAAPAVGQEGCDFSSAIAATQERAAASIGKMQHELEARAGEMREGLASQEVAMTQGEREKLDALTAQLSSQNAAEMAGQAQELAAEAEVLAQEPEVMVVGDESGWLGVEIAEVNADKAKELKLGAARGVLVVEVESDSPAAKAGLKVNDVITEYDRQEVEGTVQFRRLVRETPPGRTIPLSVWRDGRAEKLSVEIADRSSVTENRWRAFSPPNFDFHFDMPEFEGFMGPMMPTLGIGAEDVSGQLGEYFGAPGGEGVLVREVRPGTPAEKAGLKAGDIITKVDGKAVKSVAELREELRGKREQKTLSLGIIRRGSEMGLNVTLETPRRMEHSHISRRI